MSGLPFDHPDPIEVELRPRPNGPPRRMARLSARDGRAWQVLGRRVASAVEPRMGPEVAANRSVPAAGELRLEPIETSLPRLRRTIGRARRAAGTGAVFLATDVEDFFPSVSPDAVVRSLLGAGSSPRDAAQAAAALEGWASLGYGGLPIGPSTSAILANAVLRSVDDSVGVPFVRWVDDYLAILTEEAEAAEVLDRMDEALARLRLRRSVRKTRIGPGPEWLGSALGVSGRSGAAQA